MWQTRVTVWSLRSSLKRGLVGPGPSRAREAAGGFARNLKMREQYQPHPASDRWTKANPGDTGEVIQIMERAGAGLGMMDQAWWIQTLIFPETGPHHAVLETCKPHSIMVDASGSRFVNESASYMEIGNAMYERNKTVPAIPAWHVVDARYHRQYFYNTKPPGKIPKIKINAPLMVSTTRTSTGAETLVAVRGASKYMTLTTRR